MPKPQRIWPNFPLPKDLLDDENFLIDFKAGFNHLARSDDGSIKEMRRLIEVYNEASEGCREAMNEVFVWATGYSFPSLAARAALQEEPAGDRDEEAIHDLMLDWADKARWKGPV